MFKTFSVLAGLVGVAAILSAQAIDPDTFKVNYFAYNLETDANIVWVTNVGTSGGNVCADIYVFDPQQELSECCSCLVTPDGLTQLQLTYQLVENPLTGIPLDAGIIEIVSAATTGGKCPLPTAPKPTPGIRAWATHLSHTVGTETEFQDSGLSAVELSGLAARCKAIQLDGSKRGICDCGHNGG